jgi:hypothetical protein
MSLVITDETAGAVVLTIDNNGNMAFGNGTPVSPLTIGPNAVIDSDGYIMYGLSSCAISGTQGSVSCPTQTAVAVNTLAGRIPAVQIYTSIPAMTWNLDDPSGNPDDLVETGNVIPGRAVHSCQPSLAAFTVTNNSLADSRLVDPSSPYYDSNLTSGGDCGYRWI